MDHVPQVQCAMCSDSFYIDEMVYADNSVLLVCRRCYKKAEEMQGQEEMPQTLYYLESIDGGSVFGEPHRSIEEAYIAGRLLLVKNTGLSRINIRPYRSDEGFGCPVACVRVQGITDPDPDTIVIEYFYYFGKKP